MMQVNALHFWVNYLFINISNESHYNPLLTFSVDCAVPKKIGTNASQTMQVVYMVKPMGLASLKVSGTPRLLTAYTVHVTISTIL